MGWEQALVTILFGAVAGGITNSVAIWMLFHPYEPPRLLGRRLPGLQGAIPKNKARLASKIGRTVGTQLLTSQDLARTVSAPSFRGAFDEKLSAFFADLLEKERGALAEELPAALTAELDALLGEAVEAILRRLDAYLESDAFTATVERWIRQLAEDIGDQQVAELLTPEREEALARTVEGWIAEAVGGAGFERAVADYVDAAAAGLLRPGRTFEEILPQGLVAAFERGVAGYLPLALERLSKLLDDPAARAKVERLLHEILARFMRDLRFHQRLVAALVITPDTIDKVLRAVETEGADKLAELLDDPAVRNAMARGVNDAVVDFLRRPAASVLGEPGDESVENAKATITGWLVKAGREEDTRALLVEKLRAALGAAERRTWGDLFRHVPPERLARLVAGAARSAEARAVYREALGRTATALLRRPIGRPASHLPSDAPRRLERALAEPLWTWLQEQVPGIAEKVDVAGRVEQKILDYPVPRLEELIRGVTQRELRLIVQLGYVLGGLVGAVLVAVNSLF